MLKQYLNYKIFTQPFNPELITGFLWQFNLLGLIEEEDNVVIYLIDNTLISESRIKSGLEKLKKEKFNDFIFELLFTKKLENSL